MGGVVSFREFSRVGRRGFWVVLIYRGLGRWQLRRGRVFCFGWSVGFNSFVSFYYIGDSDISIWIRREQGSREAILYQKFFLQMEGIVVVGERRERFILRGSYFRDQVSVQGFVGFWLGRRLRRFFQSWGRVDVEVLTFSEVFCGRDGKLMVTAQIQQSFCKNDIFTCSVCQLVYYLYVFNEEVQVKLQALLITFSGRGGFRFLNNVVVFILFTYDFVIGFGRDIWLLYLGFISLLEKSGFS